MHPEWTRLHLQVKMENLSTTASSASSLSTSDGDIAILLNVVGAWVEEHVHNTNRVYYNTPSLESCHV